MPLSPGQSIAHYRLDEKIGVGGMGEVWKARDRKLQRDIALKVLHTAAAPDSVQQRRFLREARVAAAISHPHIATVHDVGEDNGVLFLGMELVDGHNLRVLLNQRTRLPVMESVRLAREIADGLCRAHEAGIVHRDLKPENVIIGRDGHAKILDFGLSKILSRQDPDRPQSEVETASQELTRKGTVLGTLLYMSPEQLRGRELDARSDLFSFGVILYELLTGVHPFRKETAADTQSAILTQFPPGIDRRHEMPGALQRLLEQLLAKDPASRPASAAQIHSELQSILVDLEERNKGFLQRNRMPLAVGTVLGLTAIIAALLVVNDYRRRKVQSARALIPQIQELTENGDYVQAYQLATKATATLGADPVLERLLPVVSDRLSIVTEPEDAGVTLVRVVPEGTEPEEIPLGLTPIHDRRIARADYVARIEKPDFVPIQRLVSSRMQRYVSVSGLVEAEGLTVPSHVEVPDAPPPVLMIQEVLQPDSRIPDGMVPIPGGPYRLVGANLQSMKPVVLEPYAIDRYEVSNRQYQSFVRDGGYGEQGHWPGTFVDGDRELALEDAIQRLTDRTGLPGPREWTNQDFPEGRGDHPVTGITWYEARAYCLHAGKALPTVYQWEKAARNGRLSPLGGYMMPWGLASPGDQSNFRRANFMGSGTEPVDSHDFGISPFGVYNTAGNVGEWLENARGEGFAVAGGSWADPPYRFSTGATRAPLFASDTVGFRCVTTPATQNDQGRGPLPSIGRRTPLRPVDDARFRTFLSLHRYDRKPLRPEIRDRRETPDWIREEIVFQGIDEPIRAFLYLPTGAGPPFQVLYYLPGAGALHLHSISVEVEVAYSAQIKAGRAIMALIPRHGVGRKKPEGGFVQGVLLTGQHDIHNVFSSVRFRDEIIAMVQEYRMGLDYLQNRDDIDTGRIGFLGISWGAGPLGLVLTAIEDRFASFAYVGTGIHPAFHAILPECNPVNFAPRIRGPKLLLSGKYDERFPTMLALSPLYELLAEPKRLELLETGHHPPVVTQNRILKQWFDETLAPVNR